MQWKLLACNEMAQWENRFTNRPLAKGTQEAIWLVGCFGFNGPLRQYFSLYRAVSQREGDRGEKWMDV